MALGSLVVKVGANIAEYQSAMDKAAHLTQKNFTSMQDAAKKSAATIGLAFTAAAGGLLALVKHQITAADEMSKMAQQVGITTESMSALVYAAGMAGVGMQEMGSDTAQFAKNISDARQGLGQALPAFQAMGISVTDAAGNLKGMDVLLDEIADKFATYRDGTNKTALAVQLFGSAGAKLIPMLNGGSAALHQAADEAARFGIIISTQAGKSAEAFDDNISRLKAAASGFGNEVAAQVLPSLQSWSDYMVEAAKKGDGLNDTVRDTAELMRIAASTTIVFAKAFMAVGTAIGGYAAAIAGAGRKLEELKSPFASMFPDNKMMQAGVDKVGKWGQSALDQIRDVNKDVAAKMSDMAGQLDAVWDNHPSKSTVEKAAAKIAAPVIQGAKKASAAIDPLAVQAAAVWQSVATPADILANKEEQLEKLFKSGAISADLYSAGIEKAKKAFEDAANSADPLIAVGKQLHESLMTPMEKLASQTDQYNKLLDDGAISWDDYSRAIFEAQGKIQDIGQTAKQSASFAQDLGFTFSSALEDIIAQGGSARDMLRGLGQDVLRIATRDLVTKPLDNAISGVIGNIGSGLFSGLFGSAKGNVFLNGNLQAFAEGGVVSSPALFPMAGGRTGLMGEAGPEAIMPLARGSDGKLGVRAGLGGGADVSTGGGNAGVTIIYQIGTVDARGADSGTAAHLQQLYQATIQPKVVAATVDAALAKLHSEITKGGGWARTVGRRR